MQPHSHSSDAAAEAESKLDAHSIIVGKIILDKYGPPHDDGDDDSGVTIGGGGPQAAWGAAASLAVLDYLSGGNAKDFILSNPKHQVTFLAPVGA